MQLDDTLKELLQVCADMQDGFWMAATHAQNEELPVLFQDAAVQWNAFADKIFAVLLQVDHTSPDAKWKANPNREWLNHYEDITALDDARLCLECMQGLDLAQADIRRASATVGHPQVKAYFNEQLKISTDQMATLRPYTSKGLRKSVARNRADSPGGDPPIH